MDIELIVPIAMSEVSYMYACMYVMSHIYFKKFYEILYVYVCGVVVGFTVCSSRRRQNSGCWGGCESHRRKVNYLWHNYEYSLAG